ncbi:MAG: hypothetical protein M3461_18200 [Pseudomonadota bacterium]|nr:hypothetical protein [Pseudomonadota bacterium]
MSNYIVTITTRDKWNADGSPIRDTVAEFDDLEQAIAYQDLHGGCVTRTEDDKSMAPDGTWV